jgi:hypothetical protein
MGDGRWEMADGRWQMAIIAAHVRLLKALKTDRANE